MSKKKQELKKKEKQKKAEETKNYIKELAKGQLDSKLLDSFVSVRSLSDKQKKKVKLEKKEDIIEEPQEQVNQPLQFNIFQQNFTNDQIIEEKKQEQNDEFDLEIAVKKIYPDITFDQQEKRKNDKEDKIIVKEVEESSESEEEIADQTLVQILAKQTKIYKNEIKRTEQQEQQRKDLPIYMMENDIIDLVNNNLITIISGQTGCGKSTQVPQFLYEYGYGNLEGYNPGMIGITQPRRIAAITLAQRLSEEMNFKIGEEIVYQVRHESSNISEKAKIKFQTDGILLNEMTSDFLLTKYSIIIIDEAHERKINSDLLLGLLSRVVKIRAKMALNNKISPLRLIIMSATLRIDELLQNKNLFQQKIPVIEIQSRQFEVQTFYDKRTDDNYIEQAIKKCIKIHQRLPNGNVLVFLTGELEIKQFCYQLNMRLQNDQNISSDEEDSNDLQQDMNNEQKQAQYKEYKIFPLYSKLSFQDQQMIFAKNENKRVIIASTNVAETSLTIPGVRYVIDCGKSKKKIYSKGLEILSYDIDWISQASADQRQGRAGRVGPGICYRLYSNAVYSNVFQKHTEPEILQAPLESIVLQLKAIGIKDVYKFPFPSVPDTNKLKNSHQNLHRLQALQDEEITELGKILAYIPLAPKFSKLLLLTRSFDVLQYGLLLVSVLSTEELFQQQKQEVKQEDQSQQSDSDDDEFKKQIKYQKQQQKQKQAELENKKQTVKDFKQKYSQFIQNKSDLFLKINILGEFMKFMCNNQKSYQLQDQLIVQFAQQNNLLIKNLKEIYQNIKQLLQILKTLISNSNELNIEQFFIDYKIPNEHQQNKLIESICTIFIDKIAKKRTLYNANNQPYQAYECLELNHIVYIPAISVVYHSKPEFLIYTHIQQNLYNQRYYLQNLTTLDDVSFLYKLDYKKEQLQYLKDPQPYFDKQNDKLISYCTCNFRSWKLPIFKYEFENDQIEKYYHFTKFLLEGQIFDFFKALSKVFLIKLNDIKFTNLNPLISNFVNNLKLQNLDSKEKLIQKWKQDQNFLLKETLNLIKNDFKEGVKNQWPPKF